MSQTRISQLASIIATNTAIVDEYLRSNGLPTPSFDANGPLEPPIPPEAVDIQKARRNALEASLELSDLLHGPKTLLSPQVNGTSMQAIYKYEIAAKVPIDGLISYADLATKCGLPEVDLRRILRYAISFHRVFCEPKVGFVGHSAGSRELAQNPNAHDMCGLSFDGCWQAMARTVEAMEKYGDSEPNHTGHSISNNTEDTFFAWLGKNPEKARRFAGAMRTLAPSGSIANALCDSFDWNSIGKGIVADVGGSTGHISVILAQAFPDLKFIVQDLPGAQVGAKEKIPADVSDRIELQPHDFFTEQPVKADVYFFRAVFHDWPDKHCVTILQKTIPALRKGAYIVVNDSLLPEPGQVGLLDERNNRAYDLLMMSLFNAREREEGDWKRIFADASPHLKFVKAVRPERGLLGTIVARWDGE